jgi:hypothetical protein
MAIGTASYMSPEQALANLGAQAGAGSANAGGATASLRGSASAGARVELGRPRGN